MIPKDVFEQTLLGFFSPVRAFLDDDSVTEIMINGPSRIYVERRGRIESTSAKFASGHDLLSALRNLAQYVGRPFDERRPILEAHMPDGSRVEAVMAPAATDGPTVSIRRFYREALTAEKLVAFGTISRDALALLQALVAGKQNIIVAGGTASGKTSLLNVISSYCDPLERIVVIEDSRELQLQQEHVVHLESQPGDEKGRGQITIRKLFQASLRMRPDRIVVGEIRGSEALDLIQAMTSGHGGCMSTVHATHPADTVSRLETMALMSDVALPLHALRAQVASAVSFILHATRLPDGGRVVTSIAEVVGYEPDRGYQIEELYKSELRREHGKVASRLVPTGFLPRCAPYLEALGQRLPAAMLEAAARRRRHAGGAA